MFQAFTLDRDHENLTNKQRKKNHNLQRIPSDMH